MVTIDNIVKNVPEFDGDVSKGRMNYERAKQGLELVDADVALFENSLKEQTGYDNFNLPTTKEISDIELGDVSFKIKSESRIKRPAYKEAVTGMENYLKGIPFLVSQGRAITGVLKEGRSLYVSADKLVEDFNVVVAGVMIPEVKQTIKYTLADRLDDEISTIKKGLPFEVELEQARNRAVLNSTNAGNYVRLMALQNNLGSFVKEYESALSLDTDGEGKVAVTKKAAYAVKSTLAQGTDWAYVVTSLIEVPTNPGMMGELNVLADRSVSKAEKERQFPTYKIMYHEPFGDKQIYVGLHSVFDRIGELKEDRSVVANRVGVAHKEIV